MARRSSAASFSQAQSSSRNDDDASNSSSNISEPEATTIVEDLQRCRRMVASMRGLVLATSLRQRIVRDIEQAANARALLQLNERSGMRPGLDSPRQRYLQVRMQKLVLEKLKMERMWREKKGVKRFETNALLVQRVFRGFWTRKTLYKCLSIIDVTVLRHKMTKIEALRAECASYKKKIDDHEQELRQTNLDLETTLKDKAATESKIATSKKDVTYVDAKLLDGTVVRMEAHQLLIHQINEIERLEATRARLETVLKDLNSFDPGANRAASIIQCRYRTHKHEIQQQTKLRRKRQAHIRLAVSKERCYERMNENSRLRHEQMWSNSANAIASLYQIAKAKTLLHRHRQQHAVTKIVQQYRLIKLRMQSKTRLKWLKNKRKAQRFRANRVHKWLSQVWSSWRSFITMEKARKTLIEQRVENGLTKWITHRVLRLQWPHQLTMTKRWVATQQCADQLDPVVLHSLEVLSRKLGSLHQKQERQDDDSRAKRELCAAFYEQLLCEVSAWHSPQAHLYFLSERYELPLEALPVPKIRAWLKRRLRNAATSSGFLDLHQPFPVRTLKFLAKVSSYFTLQQRVASQTRAIRVHYEAKMVVREYLALLYANNQVLYSAATTFSAQLRHEAVLLLHRKNQDEYFTETGKPPLTSFSSLSSSLVVRHAFTSFHCLWNDLCEKCLMLQQLQASVVVTTRDRHCSSVHHKQTPKQARECACCGHHHFEKSTAVNQSNMAFPKIGQNNTSTLSSSPRRTANQQQQMLLISSHERCDFLVLNAFFHALAPLDHENRSAHTPETLWKLAMAHAFGAVQMLYEEKHISSLSSLLQRLNVHSSSSDDMALDWEGVMPPQVLDTLLLFGKLLYDELLGVNAELRTRQVAAL